MEGQRYHVAIRWLLDLLFPRFCLRCEREGGNWCKDCDEVFLLTSPIPSCPFCREGESNRVCDDCRGAVFLDGLHSMTSYADPVVRRVISSWKYHCDRSVEGLLERWVRQRFSVDAFDDFDVVTHVPLHSDKYNARGFDQANVFAEMIADMSGVPHRGLLSRTKKTEARAKLPYDKRKVGHLDEVFECAEEPPGKVLLCDDVFTSGSTLDAGAKVLVENGAGFVEGCVIARGG